jgi:hypothetical protein
MPKPKGVDDFMGHGSDLAQAVRRVDDLLCWGVYAADMRTTATCTVYDEKKKSWKC